MAAVLASISSLKLLAQQEAEAELMHSGLVDLLLAVSHLGLLGRPNSGFRLHWFEKIGTWRIGRRGRGGEGKTTLEREVRLFPMVLTMVSSS